MNDLDVGEPKVAGMSYGVSMVSQKMSAFSLIEVMVAMTILSTSLLGVLGAFSLAGRTGDRAALREQAALLAEREIELAIHLPMTEQQRRDGSQGSYTWQMTFASRSHELRVVRIEVQWLGRGKIQRFELERVFVPRAMEER